jgi:hypothetical protein
LIDSVKNARAVGISVLPDRCGTPPAREQRFEVGIDLRQLHLAPVKNLPAPKEQHHPVIALGRLANGHSDANFYRPDSVLGLTCGALPTTRVRAVLVIRSVIMTRNRVNHFWKNRALRRARKLYCLAGGENAH